MIQRIDIGHMHVLAFRVEGEVDVEDMKASQEVIKSELASDGPFNLYVEMAATADVEPAAIQERLRFILSNFGEVLQKVNKMALVTDKNWLQHLATGVFTLIPAIDQRSFAFEELEEARTWVSS
ncbi:SpoIIAA family protein [Pontibacter sp. H249]|uniref:STAS/SEC14 domain-containing protein n=1 Tax=Pontibacter sp. H249 TaxID=3133420 RepID=UPI0030C21196